MPEELTPEEKKPSERILEIIASGDVSDEAQDEFDRLMTPALQRKIGTAILELRKKQERTGQER
jgi:hypothetical protein